MNPKPNVDKHLASHPGLKHPPQAQAHSHQASSGAPAGGSSPKKGLKLAAIAALIVVLVVLSLFLLSKTNFGNDIISKLGLGGKQQEPSQQNKSLDDKQTFDKALSSFNNFPGVSSLSVEEKNKLVQSTQAEYLAGYVTGFGPNDNDIEGAKFLLGQTPAQNSIASYISSIIDSKKKLALGSGYYEGYIFYFWFGNTIVNKVDGETIPNYGDPKTLEEDRNYAKQRAEEAIGQLKNGTITPQKLQENLKNDLRLALSDEANGSIFFSSNYLGNEPTKDDGRAESVNSFLKNLTSPGISGIGVINADPGIPKSGKKREVGYFAIYLDVVLKGTESIDEFSRQVVIARGKTR